MALALALPLRLAAHTPDEAGGPEKTSWVVAPVAAYPQAAKYLGLDATIVARLFVNGAGMPVKTQILRRDPVHLDMFDVAVRTALMGSRVTPPEPPEPAGTPVPPGTLYAYNAPFKFTLEHSAYQVPKVTRSVAPEMPQVLLEQGMEAWVSVLVPVAEDGRQTMSDARVVGRYPYEFSMLDANALDAVARYTFDPARRDGTALSGWTIVRVDFLMPARQSP